MGIILLEADYERLTIKTDVGYLSPFGVVFVDFHVKNYVSHIHFRISLGHV